MFLEEVQKVSIIYSGGKKKATHKIVILDPKNRDSLVAKDFSYTRSL